MKEIEQTETTEQDEDDPDCKPMESARIAFRDINAQLPPEFLEREF